MIYFANKICKMKVWHKSAVDRIWKSFKLISISITMFKFRVDNDCITNNIIRFRFDIILKRL